MNIRENIKDFVKNKVLPTIKLDEEKQIYIDLSEAFLKLGEEALTMRPEELADRCTPFVKKDLDKITLADMIAMPGKTGIEKIENEYVYPDTTYNVENWYTFLGNKMIIQFIEDKMVVINEVNLRKKLQDALSSDGKTKDWQLIKVLDTIVAKSKEKDNSVIHYSSFMIPRWDKVTMGLTKDMTRFVDLKVLSRLKFDGFDGFEEEANAEVSTPEK